MRKDTQATKASDIKRAWHLIDLKGQTLGRICSKIANLLMGKSKPYFIRNLDCGDYVVAINAKEVKATGNKELLKKYYYYSGYPGGLRTETLENLRDKNPKEIIRHAVSGMLPQNRLRDRMFTRLFIFSDASHSYKDKFNKKITVKSE